VSLAIHTTCLAHDDPNATVPALRALKVDGPITVDGVLDEPFWQEAEVATDFIDTRSGRPAAQQTKVRIAYTRTHLYIAVECFDDQIDQIHASELREDRFFRGDDWVELHLDPTHNHNAKYAFFSNPLGTRVDGSKGPGGAFSTSWSAEWDLGAEIYNDRWVLEMNIPFRILNYRREDGQTWGFNFSRQLVRTDVNSYWSYNDTDYPEPRYFGHLTGLDLADSTFDRNLEITPYVSSRTDFNGDSSTKLETGGDISFRLTPSIITSWTFNPDFAQVEADADTIELRDTERFLPEKRLFFEEGDELFGMRNRLYYSRRFTDIDAGAKVSGDWNDFKFAFIDIYGDTVHDDTYYGNSSVFRVLQSVGERSNLGYYLSSSDFKTGHSRVLGTDGNLFPNDDWRFSYQLATTDDRLKDDTGQTARDGRDYLGYGSINYEKYPWDISLGYTGITEDFDPVLGFIPRRDIFGPHSLSIYHLRSTEKWYKNFYAYIGNEYYQNHEQNTTLRDYDVGTGVTLQNDVAFRFYHKDDFHEPFDNHRTGLGVSIHESDYWRRLGVNWAVGQFEQTDYHELILAKHIKPIERWPIRYEYTVRFEEEPDGTRETVWLNRVVFDYFFSDKKWIKSSLQHRSTNVHNISVIYGWEFVKDAHLYLVYNSIREEDEPDIAHSVFIKVAYTFR
jgi:hypothetical protein